ncbi:DUF6178 family protein [Desulfobotulus mexicanus]|uniref:Uncharacterized protein n=1 Tax=Desulfobotulus mexicanus TaxID=2586642 RepID=A0A5Q4VAY7_9BACT|nr:DUF6178 family protein [Desulfobotulus mexicanus]TYT74914.1 hypothetical protein FIM25_07255 [Desulfobotulus mexicanus]
MTTQSLSPHEERLMALATKRRHLETLSEEEALDVLLSDPQALPLVHSYPEEDFFLLMHRIGPDDFLPVLSMATDRQWHFIVDQECWEKDVPDYGAMSLWLCRFLRAAPKRFVKFMVEEDGDLMDVWLFRNLEVRIREHDEDPSDFPDGFATLDDVLYFRLKPMPEDESNPEEREAREEALQIFIRSLADTSHPLYFRILQEMSWSIPAELEEAALHWRRVRLAEKGFIPAEEAGGLFQPLKEGELESRGKKVFAKTTEERVFSIPEQGLRMASMDSVFSEALVVLDTENVLADLYLEMAALCNRFIGSGGKVLRSREELDAAGLAVMGYIRVGIARITGEREPSPQACTAVLRTYRLDFIFRAGAGPVMRLKWKVGDWYKKAWFRRSGLALSFWDEEGMGLLGGFLLDMPLRFDAAASGGTYYVPFDSDGDLVRAEGEVDDILALDDVFALLGLEEVDGMGRLLTWKNMLLTLWVQDRLGEGSNRLVPVHEERFRSFFSILRKKTAGGFSIPIEIRNDFLAWLSERTGLLPAVLADRTGAVLEKLFMDLEEEIAGIPAGSMPDHRYMRFFLLRQA